MKTYHFKKIILFSILLGSSQVSWAACDQTLSPGANVASAVSSAAAGSTICLNNGNYGSANFSGISKSNYVTVQSASGKGATISPQIGGSKFLRFTNLTISGSAITNASSNIQITSSTFTDGLLINMRGSSKANYPLNILIDGSSFINLGGALWEGRISIGDDSGKQPSMGVIVSNNEISGGCLSDGVQLVAGASGVQVGPGNEFSDIIQSGPGGAYGVHCDNIQFYGDGQNNSIIGNRFRNGSSYIAHMQGPSNSLIKDNIFEGQGDGDIYRVHIADPVSGLNATIEHNTFSNSAGLFIDAGAKAIIRNNILVNSSYADGDAGYGSCASCTKSYNQSTNDLLGTNSIKGSPTFVGGSKPSTWEGYKLTSSSLGYKNGSDGLDMGTNYYGSGTPPSSGTTPPVFAAPSNLRFN